MYGKDVVILILAGGLGTRLRSKVSDLPKAMAPVAGRPFIEWQLMALKEQGFYNVVLCVGYLADKIIDHFKDGSKLGLNIGYSVENKPLGTAGAILNASEFIDNTLLLLNGDTFFDVNYRALIDFHLEKKAIISLSLTLVGNVARYGSVTIDSNARITGFREKSSYAKGLGYINAGAYVIEPSLLGCIMPNRDVSLEKAIIPRLVSERSAFGYISSGYFIDIGTPESYETAQGHFAERLSLSGGLG